MTDVERSEKSLPSEASETAKVSIGASLGRVFDPRCNALNAWRLVLATSVILWHSWPTTGHKILYRPAEQLIEQVGVDGFFAISGFLITASWMRHPRLRDFAIARGLRIFPGLWVCLLIIAFVIAPISVVIQGGSVRTFLATYDSFKYVLNNGLLNVYYAGIDGTPRGVPWPGVWDASIWTLVFEVICYIAVAVLGVTGMLKRQWVVPPIFVVSLALTTWLSYPVFAATSIAQMVARFAVMFAAGALLHQYRDVVPARWSLVALCWTVVLISGLLPNYRAVAALPLAYAVIISGALIRNPRLNLRNDFSYGVYIYAYPIQQLLAVMGLTSLNPFVFFAIATVGTVPLAVFSWFVVEKRAMRLKSRLLGSPPTASSGQGK